MLKIIYHEDYLTPYFTSVAESPLRITSIYNKLKDHYEVVSPEPAVKEDILRVHSLEHVTRVQQEGPEIYRTALLAAGGALRAARMACEMQPSFAIIRPPGHHAGRSQYGGFCFFNNMAIAVSSLLTRPEITKVVIVDIDMHRGDGTENIFADEPSVTIIDIWARERDRYLDSLQRALDGIAVADLIAVSAGFDLYVRDWGGLLETEDFWKIGCAVYRTAVEKAEGRCFALLEGGYFLNDLGKNALAFCRGLEGRASDENRIDL